ncbi:4-(cytidine 5'-diphospho)-2-C-methyl-D-erythritol kinase [Paracoccus sp. YIM 132242]|uniref:4-diphosphocytidyl-2-C-methyl-D-erythritol kinase n=1 Tax=Paracoccus lichenicola TaxID=2665644 RepID=A0A6L6HUF9_9RHOB|nr:4-(cytidine 5'-diphospho)-2-C-methyl-D-erythritol kinase [Paracoccus lichenicola]MTE01813.1 4-(cytidine 5'-diphospho)-2-C-methyl-D-erythritol kinase [Paracoccus lichenicola]
MPPVVEAAPAKLNLALHVTGRRADGYHLLDSLVAFAGVGDVVTLEPGPLSLRIDGPFAAGLSTDDNLCLRAARLAGADAAITLTKTLPVASGIGGGSADAAAVLRGLVQMGHALPLQAERLGADVPVCLASGPARMQGVGEVVTPLPPLPPIPLVLVNPGIALSTPQVFAAMDRRDNPGLPAIPRFAGLADLTAWLAGTRNDLEPAALSIAPAVGQVLDALRTTGAAFARMSGSGATCFGFYDSPDRARIAATALKRHGWWAVATELAPPLAAR